MRLLQLNIWNGRLDKHLLRFFERQEADILCLQEVSSYQEDLPFVLQLERIASQGGYEHVFFTPMFRYNALGLKIDFGNAILSRFPLQHTYSFFTRAAYNPDYVEGDDYNLRNVQHAVIDYKGMSIHLLNHHGHHVPEHKNGTQDTDKQMQATADYIADLSGPVVFCGDLNLAPHSRSLKPLNSLLTNLSVKYGLTTTRPPITDRTEVCDYIFTSPQLKIKTFTALEDIVSDHQALLLEL